MGGGARRGGRHVWRTAGGLGQRAGRELLCFDLLCEALRLLQMRGSSPGGSARLSFVYSCSCFASPCPAACHPVNLTGTPLHSVRQPCSLAVARVQILYDNCCSLVQQGSQSAFSLSLHTGKYPYVTVAVRTPQEHESVHTPLGRQRDKDGTSPIEEYRPPKLPEKPNGARPARLAHQYLRTSPDCWFGRLIAATQAPLHCPTTQALVKTPTADPAAPIRPRGPAFNTAPPATRPRSSGPNALYNQADNIPTTRKAHPSPFSDTTHAKLHPCLQHPTTCLPRFAPTA